MHGRRGRHLENVFFFFFLGGGEEGGRGGAGGGGGGVAFSLEPKSNWLETW